MYNSCIIHVYFSRFKRKRAMCFNKKRIRHIWRGMISRCTNKGNSAYYRYGGRGITISQEWMNYENFEKWALENGYRDDLTIDRIDNDGNYESSNCRWVDMITQANNKSNNLLLTYKGRIQTLAQWVRELGLSYKVTIHRLNEGWSVEDAFEKEKRFDGIETLTYNGKTQTVMQWAEETGMTYNTIKHRVRKGLPVEEILTKPQEEHDISKTYYRGECHSLREWAKILNIPFTTISYRINNMHMSIEEAFETPVKPHTKDITFNNKTQSVKEWSRELGIPYNILQYRLNAGWSIEKALTHKDEVITYKGESHTYREWSKILGIPTYVLRNRVKSGWSVEDTLTKPVKSNKKTKH